MPFCILTILHVDINPFETYDWAQFLLQTTMRKLLLVLPIILFFVSVFFQPVLAQTSLDYLRVDQIIDSDYIRAANTVQIDGEIKGDAFLLGSVVTINGKIDGDLFIAGAKVIVNGTVGSNVRIVGADVTLNGPVGRNVLLVCASCSLSNQSSVKGSILVSAASFDLFSKEVGRGLRFFGRRLYINSPIGSEAFVVADSEFFLGPQASISGDLKYTGNSEVIIQPGASVSGTIAYQKADQNANFPRFFGARSLFSFYEQIRPLADVLGFLISALIGWILLGLFPTAFEKVSQAIENRPYASLGWGVIIVLLVPLMVFLFAITIVGIPVSVVLILISYVCFVLAQFLGAFFLGRKILLSRFGERRGWALVLGLFLIYLLGLIPIFGTLVKIVLVLFSLGAIVPAYKQPVILLKKSPLMVSQELLKIDRRSQKKAKK